MGERGTGGAGAGDRAPRRDIDQGRRPRNGTGRRGLRHRQRARARDSGGAARRGRSPRPFPGPGPDPRSPERGRDLPAGLVLWRARCGDDAGPCRTALERRL